MAVVGLAPVTFEGQGTHVGFHVKALGKTHQLVASLVVHAIQARADGQGLGRRGDQRVVQPNGEAVVFPMRLEFQAAVQLDMGARVAAIVGAIQAKLCAFGIEELAVVQSVVMFFVVAGWEQATEAQLLAH